jgi:hypothetical protein
MFSKWTQNFPHRLNSDGNYDSICRVCLATIASAPTEAELAPLESAHICNPTRLYHLGKSPLPRLHQ